MQTNWARTFRFGRLRWHDRPEPTPTTLTCNARWRAPAARAQIRDIRLLRIRPLSIARLRRA